MPASDPADHAAGPELRITSSVTTQWTEEALRDIDAFKRGLLELGVPALEVQADLKRWQTEIAPVVAEADLVQARSLQEQQTRSYEEERCQQQEQEQRRYEQERRQQPEQGNADTRSNAGTSRSRSNAGTRRSAASSRSRSRNNAGTRSNAGTSRSRSDAGTKSHAVTRRSAASRRSRSAANRPSSASNL